MYYKVDNRIYTPEEIKGKTFHEGNKPEPLFTLDEMKEAYDIGYLHGEEERRYQADDYFKQQFNITI